MVIIFFINVVDLEIINNVYYNLSFDNAVNNIYLMHHVNYNIDIFEVLNHFLLFDKIFYNDIIDHLVINDY